MPEDRTPVILTIAGFDPSSGAGVTADLKTIAAHGCYGMASITALTVQNTQRVARLETVRPELVAETLMALSSDIEFAAIKLGMMGSAGVAKEVAHFLGGLKRIPVVLDPVLWSSSGAGLLEEAGVKVLEKELLPLTTAVTPNWAEASALTGVPIRSLNDMRSAARRLQELGAKNVVITGGHSPENTDVLRLESGEEFEMTGQRVDSRSTHGTGCAFSTAIACRLAVGDDLPEAVRRAKKYVREAIQAAYPIGKGAGPLNHLFGLRVNPDQ